MVETTSPLPKQVRGAAELHAIAALPDPVQRNLQITLAYYDLNHALAARLGYQNGNWCVYTTWASKTAGAFIRGERSSLSLQEYLEQADYVVRALARLHQVLARSIQTISLKPALLSLIIDQITHEVATHIARGNQLVFAEMAPLFARFLETCGESATYRASDLARFLTRHLIPGPVGSGGQDMLIRAFTHYYEAMFMPESKARAELILLANLYVAYHEQTRLQPALSRAMDAPLALKLEEGLVDASYRWLLDNLPPALAQPIGRGWRAPLRRLTQRVAADWQPLVTRWLMTIRLPAETLRLGKDVPHLETDEMFPADLRHLEHPALLALLQELDGTLDTSRGSAANDWGCLRDRMNFLVDFFRSRQQDARLFQQPFCNAQVAVIRAGGIPAGPL